MIASVVVSSCGLEVGYISQYIQPRLSEVLLMYKGYSNVCTDSIEKLSITAGIGSGDETT